jgi:hypothetical protein
MAEKQKSHTQTVLESSLGKQEIEFMKAWHGLPVVFTNATK